MLLDSDYRDPLLSLKYFVAVSLSFLNITPFSLEIISTKCQISKNKGSSANLLVREKV